MRNPIEGAHFRRDVKLAQKRGTDMKKLREVLLLLIEGGPGAAALSIIRIIRSQE
ncbi:MAG: type II toxin-antitoxin system YafQ family toxin [Acidobacteriia bacterium]|nr:type II toxin-antitoxin system YafQ family toxin [Terriglobia bacterium]